jgi:hypothetical protein
MQIRSIPCPRCRRQNHAQQAVCSFCGTSLASWPRRWNGWVVLPLLALTLLLGKFMLPQRGPAEVEITWDELGPVQAEGRIRNLTHETIFGLTIHQFAGIKKNGFVRRAARFSRWPPITSTMLRPGEEVSFELDIPLHLNTDFPVHPSVENQTKEFRYQERWGEKQAFGP